MPEIDKQYMGGNMRIGSKTTFIKDKNSLAAKVHYGNVEVVERHWHWFEVNVKYK